MDLNTQVKEIPRIGPTFLRKLKKLNIGTVGDLIYHFPFRYETYGGKKKIGEVVLGEVASVSGEVWQIRNVRTRFRKNLTLAKVADSSGTIEVVWFNQPFLIKTLPVGSKISLAGKIDLFSQKPTFINPEYELLSKTGKKPLHTTGLVPIYPETAGLNSKWLRKQIKEVLPSLLPKVEEVLPAESLKRNRLIGRRQAIWQIHAPTSEKRIEAARKRLAFDELLIISLQAKIRKAAWQKPQGGVALPTNQEKILRLIQALPFHLTEAQSKVLKEILADLSQKKPMNRLLQGDVGSGKTVVAAIAAYSVFLNGFQTAIMAPTEILAIQHFNTLKAILAPCGVKISLRTSARKRNEPFDCLVGTHALLSSTVSFEKLAFAVIDEQHRFGVKQRGLLRSKGIAPHVLTMTATPIPRSLALTLYGDLDISTIDELPKGRRIVKTYVVPLNKRGGAYQFIREKTAVGEQVFIICPLIDPSETLASAKAANQEYKRLQEDVFPDLSLGLLHGRMKSKEKERVLEEFLSKKYYILVATPVVEVGIDIPGATVMLIEAAERFGLASLHQLRGRVGRSSQQSYCFLFTESRGRAVLDRLKALERHYIGLKLAEIDLQMRGPGQIYGTAQSGLTNFKIANLADLPTVESVKKEADILFDQITLEKLPALKNDLESSGPIAPD
ncbi:MAG: ATP-dependent DNA helicase RecG [Candidatus Woykebacteria bacterium GWA1_44_8]|uniref:Probable DNA 3'-5' helicase RecG n=1 Tax=Candidatus Woykebacteria bacterium GWA1_44_8 TaxID=1802591 RepID=A0A1G1W3K9_9BACT|nr:MAG: ATP-dependent DNA helicase RecG [Candidatus Woykebacteria bacterium GWA1_44_8]